jgi:hypothetical protein
MIKGPALAGQSLCLALLACNQPEVVPFMETDASGPFADAADETKEDGGRDSGSDASDDSGADGGASRSDSGATGESLDGSDGATASHDGGVTRAREICRASCESGEHLPCYSQSCLDDCLMFRAGSPACSGRADAYLRCTATLGEEDYACSAQGASRTTEECQAELDAWQGCVISQG